MVDGSARFAIANLRTAGGEDASREKNNDTSCMLVV